jgi:ParB family chromosome partitioning protein
MSEWVGIEELRLSPARPPGPLPVIPVRLLNAIRDYGPIEPVVVRRLGPNHFEILSNVETWLAVQRLGEGEVPIEIREGVDDDEAAELVELSYQRRKRDAIDEALYLQERLDELGGRKTRGATKRVAVLTGLSRTYVSHALRLLELPGQVQEMIRDGRIQVGHAKPLVTITDRRVLLRLARKIATEGLSVRTAEELARKARAGEAPPVDESSASPDPDIVRLESRVSELVGCDVRIDTADGKLVVDYAHDLEVLDGFLKRIGYDDK